MKVGISSLLIFGLAINILFAQKPAPKENPLYIKKGQKYLSASDLSFGLSLGNNFPSQPSPGFAKEFNQMSTGVKLGYGVMVTDRVMIGARIGYNGNFIWGDGIRFGGSHAWNSGLFSRYYFTRGKWSTFAEVGIGTSFFSNHSGVPSEVSSFYQEAKVGVQYHFNDRVSLEISNGIRHSRFYGNSTGFPPPVKNKIGILNPSMGINFRL